MKRVSWLLLGGCLLGSLSVPAAAIAAKSEEDLSAWKARHAQAVAELAGELNNEIRFYGQVTDLDGVPVAAAMVKMTVRVAGAIPPAKEFERFQLMTDGEGRFVAETFGDVIGIDGIVREGYTYHYRYNRTRDFKSKKLEQRQSLGFEPDKPATFRIRKLAPPAFVVLHNMTFGLKPGTEKQLDLVRRAWIDANPGSIFSYKMNFPDWHADLLLSVDGEPEKLRLILEALDADSGFVIEKHEFFEQMVEAPEHGYKQRLEIPVKSTDSPAMLYVKCQGGLFYAKIYIEFSEPKPGVVAVNATSFTNLSRGRGLEYIPAIESQHDREVYSEHTRDLVRRADLLSGQPIEMPKVREK
jgi:hypothetical protein